MSAHSKSPDHCRDCCCAQSWKALGVTEYDGKSIPEHITALQAELAALKSVVIQAWYDHEYLWATVAQESPDGTVEAWTARGES